MNALIKLSNVRWDAENFHVRRLYQHPNETKAVRWDDEEFDCGIEGHIRRRLSHESFLGLFH